MKKNGKGKRAPFKLGMGPPEGLIRPCIHAYTRGISVDARIPIFRNISALIISDCWAFSPESNQTRDEASGSNNKTIHLAEKNNSPRAPTSPPPLPSNRVNDRPKCERANGQCGILVSSRVMQKQLRKPEHCDSEVRACWQGCTTRGPLARPSPERIDVKKRFLRFFIFLNAFLTVFLFLKVFLFSSCEFFLSY